jgi:hypothetical protein
MTTPVTNIHAVPSNVNPGTSVSQKKWPRAGSVGASFGGSYERREKLLSLRCRIFMHIRRIGRGR